VTKTRTGRSIAWWTCALVAVATACAASSTDTGDAVTGTGAAGPGPGGSGGGQCLDVDADMDGFTDCAGDCSDGDPAIHPDAAEICDDIDNDCDGETDDDATDGTTWYEDKDGDGVGISGVTQTACEQPDGYAAEAGDCNDDDPAFYPGAPENDCTDPNDYNCDGSVGFADADNDGFAACEECNDANPEVHPGHPELCDGLDNDCNGNPDAPGGENDDDNDGSLACADCDDADGQNFPGNSEQCDGQDNDCNSVADAQGGEFDNDNDTSLSCEDCDDNNPSNFPGNGESCDGFDNNCNGLADFPGELVNADGDPAVSCVDCDDQNPQVYPSAAELCDGLDNNCNNVADAPGGEVDGDNDGSLSCADCDDADPNVFPGNPEQCDGIDNNCNLIVDQSEVPVNILCPQVPNAVEDCGGSLGCTVVGCNANFYDVNLVFNDGCECLADPSPANTGDTCANAINIGTLIDNPPSTISVSGNTPFPGRSIWYVVTAVDDLDFIGDEFHVDGRFTVNPGNGYVMDIYRGGCPGTGTQLGTAQDMFDWYTDFPRTTVGCTGPAPCGEGNCGPPGNTAWNDCQDNGATFLVRVYDGSNQAVCSTFTLELTNGVY
jgi:hypothetical protein